MRRPLLAATFLLAPAALVSCTALTATASKVDDRTFKIEGPGVPGGAEAPNRRTAERVCPGGYRVLDSMRHKEGQGDTGSDAAISTTWMIRCL
jgi:hypothetical protein